jgi:hypothetical protein
LAVRHPEFGVALLGLRYYLYHARSVRPVVEPDAHEYHRNFSGPTLVDALAEVFQVDDFHTTLAAAYFVDETLIGPKWIKELARLEKSLSTEPGLNIIACARKDEPGVTKSAQKQLDKYKDPKPLTIHQFEALFGFGTRAIDSHQTTSFFNSVRAPSLLDVAGLREAVAGRRVILAGSRLEPSDYSSAEAVERLGPAGPEQRHWKAFDVGVFRFESSITAAELRRLLECVQDCGIVYLEVAEIADLTDDDRTTWLSPYVILNERGGRGLNLCVSRCLQGPLDFYSALDAAFVRESDPAKLYTKKYLRMREKMNIRMGSYLRVHSYWQLFNLGRTLSNRLWVTRPAASARPAAA